MFDPRSNSRDTWLVQLFYIYYTLHIFVCKSVAQEIKTWKYSHNLEFHGERWNFQMSVLPEWMDQVRVRQDLVLIEWYHRQMFYAIIRNCWDMKVGKSSIPGLITISMSFSLTTLCGDFQTINNGPLRSFGKIPWLPCENSKFNVVFSIEIFKI